MHFLRSLVNSHVLRKVSSCWLMGTQMNPYVYSRNVLLRVLWQLFFLKVLLCLLLWNFPLCIGRLLFSHRLRGCLSTFQELFLSTVPLCYSGPQILFSLSSLYSSVRLLTSTKPLTFLWVPLPLL